MEYREYNLRNQEDKEQFLSDVQEEIDCEGISNFLVFETWWDTWVDSIFVDDEDEAYFLAVKVFRNEKIVY